MELLTAKVQKELRLKAKQFWAKQFKDFHVRIRIKGKMILGKTIQLSLGSA